MKVLVTGANGFLGRAICTALREKGYKSTGIFRNINNKTDVVDNSVLVPDLFGMKIEALRELMAGFDAVIHTAWYVDHDDYQTSSENIKALVGTLNIAYVAFQLPNLRFIGIGTCLEYDLTQPMPLKVNSPLKPETLYSSSKATAFSTLLKLFEGDERRFAWCRLFYLYGDNEDSRRLYGSLIDKLTKNEVVQIANGDLERDYLQVNEAAIKIIEVLDKERYGAINICSGKPTKISDFAIKLARRLGKENLVKFGSKTNKSGQNIIQKIVGEPN